jgi:phosphopentomutase
MSEPYLKAIENADACLAQVLEHWDGIVCVVSDHGGHDRSHGTDCAEDMTIPFILHGPGIAVGRELTDPIFLYDVCPTIAHALKIPACREWDGRVVQEAFE